MSENTLKKYPENCNDLKRMIETSKGWFDGKVQYEKLVEGSGPYPVGCEYERIVTVCVHDYNDTVVVTDANSVVTKITDDKSWSSTRKTNWSREYSFDEFKASEWWPLAMDAFKDGDPDNTPFEEFSCICDGEHGCLSMEIEDAYTDWLGNNRIGKNHKRFRCQASSYDRLELSYGDEAYTGTFAELFELIDEAKTFREANITFEKNKYADDKLIVMFPKSDDN